MYVRTYVRICITMMKNVNSRACINYYHCYQAMKNTCRYHYLLCGNHPEILRHSLICSSTVPFPEKCANQGYRYNQIYIVKEGRMHCPGPRSGNIRANDLMDILKKFLKKSNCQRLYWILFGVTVWHLCMAKEKEEVAS